MKFILNFKFSTGYSVLINTIDVNSAEEELFF